MKYRIVDRILRRLTQQRKPGGEPIASSHRVEHRGRRRRSGASDIIRDDTAPREELERRGKRRNAEAPREDFGRRLGRQIITHGEGGSSPGYMEPQHGNRMRRQGNAMEGGRRRSRSRRSRSRNRRHQDGIRPRSRRGREVRRSRSPRRQPKGRPMRQHFKSPRRMENDKEQTMEPSTSGRKRKINRYQSRSKSNIRSIRKQYEDSRNESRSKSRNSRKRKPKNSRRINQKRIRDVTLTRTQATERKRNHGTSEVIQHTKPSIRMQHADHIDPICTTARTQGKHPTKEVHRGRSGKQNWTRNEKWDLRPMGTINPGRYKDSHQARQGKRSRYDPDQSRQNILDQSGDESPQRMPSNNVAVPTKPPIRAGAQGSKKIPGTQHRHPITESIAAQIEQDQQQEWSNLHFALRKTQTAPPGRILQAPPHFPPIPAALAVVIPRVLSSKATSYRAEYGRLDPVAKASMLQNVIPAGRGQNLGAPMLGKSEPADSGEPSRPSDPQQMEGEIRPSAYKGPTEPTKDIHPDQPDAAVSSPTVHGRGERKGGIDRHPESYGSQEDWNALRAQPMVSLQLETIDTQESAQKSMRDVKVLIDRREMVDPGMSSRGAREDSYNA